MKVIISRKGFDGENGGVPSAILEDGRLIPFPIPASNDPSTYDDVRVNGVAIGELVEDLTGGKILRTRSCHLDPDIDDGSLLRAEGWRQCFGQDSAAQGHLRKQNVSEGDLFLFFGWFRRVEKASSRWRYVRGAPHLHVLYGWLRVGQIIRLGHGERPSPLEAFLRHPHLHDRTRETNTLYMADNQLGVAGIDAPGAGLFRRLTANRTLTDRSQMNRSVWRLPGWMHPERSSSLTYHSDPQRWSMDGGECIMKSVAKGQEFVLQTDIQNLGEWIDDLFTE
jgi:hypothetical protein